MVNCALLCDSSLLIVSAKAIKPDVFSYFTKANVNFLLEVILLPRQRRYLESPKLQEAKHATSAKHFAQTRHKCNFPNSHFFILVVKNNKGPQVLTTK